MPGEPTREDRPKPPPSLVALGFMANLCLGVAVVLFGFAPVDPRSFSIGEVASQAVALLILVLTFPVIASAMALINFNNVAGRVVIVVAIFADLYAAALFASLISALAMGARIQLHYFAGITLATIAGVAVFYTTFAFRLYRWRRKANLEHDCSGDDVPTR